MKRFARLLDQLSYQSQRNAKLRLVADYFASAPDPDRGYALAALTGDLVFRHAKAGLFRELAAARTDPMLFGLSYDYVGDLAETVALIWPQRPNRFPAAGSRHHRRDPGGLAQGQAAGDRRPTGSTGSMPRVAGR